MYMSTERNGTDVCVTPVNQSVRLNVPLNPITAIVRLCSSIGQLQLSENTRTYPTYTKLIYWPKHVIPSTRDANYRLIH